MSDRLSVRETVFHAERYDGEWPPENFAGAMDWFREKLESIPAEHRTTARLVIDSVGSWEDTNYATIEISFTRPETDEEVAARAKAVMDNIAEREANERAQLEALKRKYGA